MNFARRTFRSRPLALSVLIALLLAVPGVSGAVSQPAPSHTPGSALSVPLDAASVYSGSFVERAGYEAGYDASVSNAVPASGTQLITITFRPSDPSFFAPPSTGALPLSLAQIANRFGLSPAAYASAEAYFESKGLNVVYPSPDRLEFRRDRTGFGGPAGVRHPDRLRNLPRAGGDVPGKSAEPPPSSRIVGELGPRTIERIHLVRPAGGASVSARSPPRPDPLRTPT